VKHIEVSDAVNHILKTLGKELKKGKGGWVEGKRGNIEFLLRP
jgi:hypothetical protein